LGADNSLLRAVVELGAQQIAGLQHRLDAVGIGDFDTVADRLWILLPGSWSDGRRSGGRVYRHFGRGGPARWAEHEEESEHGGPVDRADAKVRAIPDIAEIGDEKGESDHQYQPQHHRAQGYARGTIRACDSRRRREGCEAGVEPMYAHRQRPRLRSQCALPVPAKAVATNGLRRRLVLSNLAAATVILRVRRGHFGNR
jgi:hypothetical protein